MPASAAGWNRVNEFFVKCEPRQYDPHLPSEMFGDDILEGWWFSFFLTIWKRS